MIPPARAPAIRPTARLIAPNPAQARPMDTPAPSQLLHLVGNHLLVLAEVPLQQRGRHGDNAVDHDVQSSAPG